MGVVDGEGSSDLSDWGLERTVCILHGLFFLLKLWYLRAGDCQRRGGGGVRRGEGGGEKLIHRKEEGR